MSDQDPYCLPGTNVLKNKLGITDANDLEKAERLISTVRTRDVPPLKTFDLAEYQNIHATLFRDIYDWAGEPRHQTPVLDGAGSEYFLALDKGLASLSKTFSHLSANKSMLLQGNDKQFSEMAGFVFMRVNQAHIFRDGNGRSQRLLLKRMAEYGDRKMDLHGLRGPAWNVASIMATSDQNGQRFINEQINFAISDQAQTQVLQKTEARGLLMEEYQQIEALGAGKNSPALEHYSETLVADVATTLKKLEGFKGRAVIEIPAMTPTLLLSTHISRAIDKVVEMRKSKPTDET